MPLFASVMMQARHLMESTLPSRSKQMPVNNPEAYGKGQVEETYVESDFQPYPVTQPVSQTRFDTYEKLQTGAPGKPAPKQVRN
jgi:hypothetical protein